MLSPDELMTVEYIIKDVLGAQIEPIFDKMDKLEEEWVDITDMPVERFREHRRLSTAAARLAISRDRILRRIRTWQKEDAEREEES
jgi:hypothetical protein